MPNSTNKALRPGDTSVILLAAGRGQRMMPLTKSQPKPLLKIGDHGLIEHHLRRLAELGFSEIVINLAYLGPQIREQLGDGRSYGLNIKYSDESDCGALETAGGIQFALPLITSDPFLAVNADIWTDFDFTELLSSVLKLGASTMGRLVLVDNPPHNPKGDFRIDANGMLATKDFADGKTYTFSGIALYKKAMFKHLGSGKQALAPLFQNAIQAHGLATLKYNGVWHDVGTPERLRELNELNQGNKSFQ